MLQAAGGVEGVLRDWRAVVEDEEQRERREEKQREQEGRALLQKDEGTPGNSRNDERY